MNKKLIEELKAAVGPQGFREGDDIDPRNFRDVMRARRERPVLLLRPASVAEVSRIMALCHAAGQAVAPQGGMTGLVSAAAPLTGEVALSFERMKQIVEIDVLTSSITVEAGVELQTLQETAERNDLLFPLDLGARGSCTVGGNLSTNAGGNRVIRHGMMRDLVLGLEVVLADGTVIDGLSKLRKNNTGYDLKHLFIGSEGTLGIITKAVFKLVPRPATQDVAFCGVSSFDQVADLLVLTQKKLGANLTAFEMIWQNTYSLIQQHVPRVSPPIAADYDYYVLIESMGGGAETDRQLFEQTLHAALEDGLVADAVMSRSSADVHSLWAVRDAAAEIYPGVGFMHNYDVSLNVADMGYFGREIVTRLTAEWPNAVIGLFGHIGDGNVHIIIHTGPDTAQCHEPINSIIYGLIRELKGAVSAEHGIGMMKKAYLSYSRSEAEITLMKALKRTLDPAGILNPGRVV